MFANIELSFKSKNLLWGNGRPWGPRDIRKMEATTKYMTVNRRRTHLLPRVSRGDWEPLPRLWLLGEPTASWPDSSSMASIWLEKAWTEKPDHSSWLTIRLSSLSLSLSDWFAKFTSSSESIVHTLGMMLPPSSAKRSHWCISSAILNDLLLFHSSFNKYILSGFMYQVQ